MGCGARRETEGTAPRAGSGPFHRDLLQALKAPPYDRRASVPWIPLEQRGQRDLAVDPEVFHLPERRLRHRLSFVRGQIEDGPGRRSHRDPIADRNLVPRQVPRCLRIDHCDAVLRGTVTCTSATPDPQIPHRAGRRPMAEARRPAPRRAPPPSTAPVRDRSVSQRVDTGMDRDGVRLRASDRSTVFPDRPALRPGPATRCRADVPPTRPALAPDTVSRAGRRAAFRPLVGGGTMRTVWRMATGRCALPGRRRWPPPPRGSRRLRGSWRGPAGRRGRSPR